LITSALVLDCESKLVVNFIPVLEDGQEVILLAKSDLEVVRDWNLELFLCYNLLGSTEVGAEGHTVVEFHACTPSKEQWHSHDTLSLFQEIVLDLSGHFTVVSIGPADTKS